MVVEQERPPPIAVGGLVAERFRVKQLVEAKYAYWQYEVVDVKALRHHERRSPLWLRLSKKRMHSPDRGQLALARAQPLIGVVSPYVVPLVAVGLYDCHCFYCLEIPKGVTLLELIEGEGAQRDLLARPSFTIQTLVMGLDFLHTRGYTITDLSARDIVVTVSGSAVLTNLGFREWERESDERLDLTGDSLAYASPEMLARESSDGVKADVFSLACLAYEVISGSFLFRFNKSYETRCRGLECVQTSALDTDQERAIAHALAAAPNGRTGSAIAFLDEFLGRERLPANLGSVSPLRLRTLILILGLVIAFLIGLALSGMLFPVRSERSLPNRPRPEPVLDGVTDDTVQGVGDPVVVAVAASRSSSHNAVADDGMASHPRRGNRLELGGVGGGGVITPFSRYRYGFGVGPFAVTCSGKRVCFLARPTTGQTFCC